MTLVAKRLLANQQLRPGTGEEAAGHEIAQHRIKGVALDVGGPCAIPFQSALRHHVGSGVSLLSGPLRQETLGEQVLPEQVPSASSSCDGTVTRTSDP